MNVKTKIVQTALRLIVVGTLAAIVILATQLTAVNVYLSGHKNGCIDTMLVVGRQFQLQLNMDKVEKFCAIQSEAEFYKVQ